jgi:hypothetical protein
VSREGGVSEAEAEAVHRPVVDTAADAARMSELAALRQALASLTWTYAKTMPHIPHSYVVRGRTAPEELYTELFQAIRRWGVNMKFGPYRNRYLFPGDGYKYWAMGWVINRDTVLDPAMMVEGPAPTVKGEKPPPEVAAAIGRRRRIPR